MWCKNLCKNIKFRDILLLLFIIGISGLYLYMGFEKNKERKVVVYQKGRKKEYDLKEDRIIDISSHKIQIKNLSVRVIESSCNLKICKKQGWVKDGVIICVPKKVAIEIYGKKNDSKFDVIVR